MFLKNLKYFYLIEMIDSILENFRFSEKLFEIWIRILLYE